MPDANDKEIGTFIPMPCIGCTQLIERVKELEEALRELLSKRSSKDFYTGEDFYMHVSSSAIKKAETVLKSGIQAKDGTKGGGQ